jgi:hypothetical protein
MTEPRMAFDPAGLSPLVQSSGFTLWLYRTSDARAVALSAGYFDPVAQQLNTGDVVLLQAADSVSLLPVRSGDVLAAGLTLDATAAPFQTSRRIAQRLRVRQAAQAVAMTIALAPLAAGLTVGSAFQTRASVAGPVAQVVFSLQDPQGAAAQPAQTIPVAAGEATATFLAPAPGHGYRIRAEAMGNSAVAVLSPPFVVSPPFTLVLENGGGRLLQQNGSSLLL